MLERIAGARVVWQLGIENLRDGLVSLPIFIGHSAVILTFALVAKKWLVPRLGVPSAEWITSILLGYFASGLLVLTMGHLALLDRFSLALVGVAAILALWPVSLVARERSQPQVAALESSPTGVEPRWPQGFGIAAVTVVLVIAFAAALRGNGYDDDHRWPSIERWLAAERWVDSGQRLTNGPAMTELLMVPTALFGASAAIYWMSISISMLAPAACGAMLGATGTPQALFFGAAFSVPVFTASVVGVGSDTISASLALGALLVTVDAFKGQSRFSHRHALSIGCLLAACYSVKFTACVVAVPIGVLLIGMLVSRRVALRQLLTVALVPAAVVSMWCLHTYSLTGRMFDSTGKYLATTLTDPMFLTGAAAGRVPGAVDLLRLPADLVRTTVLGQAEPFGGRTGLYWFAALITGCALFVIGRRRSEPAMRNATITVGVLLAAALMCWCILGAVSPKTRFNLQSFLLLASCGTALSVMGIRELTSSRLRAAIAAMLLLLCCIGVLDGIRKQLIGVALLPNPGPAALGAGAAK